MLLNMVCERILGNIADAAGAPGIREIDYIDLHWFDCSRRALRRTSRGGRRIAILLPPGRCLRHGDILIDRPEVRIAAEIIPSEVLVIRPQSSEGLALLAFELGNLHVPAEILDDEIRVAPDGPVSEVVERLRMRSELRICRFQPLFTAAGVTLSPSLQIIRSSGAPTGKDGVPG
jgi:urease accessory protein